MAQALTINHLSKTFFPPKRPAFTAVDDVSFEIEEGTIHGLLGPNGAGKTTLINMISGMMRPTKGDLQIFGVDVLTHTDQTKQLVGLVPQETVVEMAFTVEEVLYYFGGMYGVPREECKKRIAQALEDLSLSDKAKERARNLSGGMKRRLMIAKAMIHRPKLLILDEPTAGVDVALRQKIWELVRRVNAEGTTILFTTHYLEEAEQLCKRITLIDHGKMIKNGVLKDIQQEFAQNVIHFELFERNAEHLPGVKNIGSEFEYPTTNLGKDLADLTKHYGDNIKTIRNDAASLEEIFLKLTNR
jgi:ABC-2 type transport system ATP-binding protein